MHFSFWTLVSVGKPNYLMKAASLNSRLGQILNQRFGSLMRLTFPWIIFGSYIELG
jgi:hypothetical protein